MSSDSASARSSDSGSEDSEKHSAAQTSSEENSTSSSSSACSASSSSISASNSGEEDSDAGANGDASGSCHSGKSASGENENSESSENDDSSLCSSSDDAGASDDASSDAGTDGSNGSASLTQDAAPRERTVQENLSEAEAHPTVRENPIEMEAKAAVHWGPAYGYLKTYEALGRVFARQYDRRNEVRAFKEGTVLDSSNFTHTAVLAAINDAARRDSRVFPVPHELFTDPFDGSNSSSAPAAPRSRGRTMGAIFGGKSSGKKDMISRAGHMLDVSLIAAGQNAFFREIVVDNIAKEPAKIILGHIAQYLFTRTGVLPVTWPRGFLDLAASLMDDEADQESDQLALSQASAAFQRNAMPALAVRGLTLRRMHLDRGFAELSAELKRNTRSMMFQTMDFSYCFGMQDGGAARLADGLPYARYLTVLRLRGCDLTAAGVASILHNLSSNGRAVTMLRVMDFSDNDLSADVSLPSETASTFSAGGAAVKPSSDSKAANGTAVLCDFLRRARRAQNALDDAEVELCATHFSDAVSIGNESEGADDSSAPRATRIPLPDHEATYPTYLHSLALRNCGLDADAICDAISDSQYLDSLVSIDLSYNGLSSSSSLLVGFQPSPPDSSRKSSKKSKKQSAATELVSVLGKTLQSGGIIGFLARKQRRAGRLLGHCVTRCEPLRAFILRGMCNTNGKGSTDKWMPVRGHKAVGGGTVVDRECAALTSVDGVQVGPEATCYNDEHSPSGVLGTNYHQIYDSAKTWHSRLETFEKFIKVSKSADQVRVRPHSKKSEKVARVGKVYGGICAAQFAQLLVAAHQFMIDANRSLLKTMHVNSAASTGDVKVFGADAAMTQAQHEERIRLGLAEAAKRKEEDALKEIPVKSFDPAGLCDESVFRLVRSAHGIYAGLFLDVSENPLGEIWLRCSPTAEATALCCTAVCDLIRQNECVTALHFDSVSKSFFTFDESATGKTDGCKTPQPGVTPTAEDLYALHTGSTSGRGEQDIAATPETDILDLPGRLWFTSVLDAIADNGYVEVVNELRTRLGIVVFSAAWNTCPESAMELRPHELDPLSEVWIKMFSAGTKLHFGLRGNDNVGAVLSSLLKKSRRRLKRRLADERHGSSLTRSVELASLDLVQTLPWSDECAPELNGFARLGASLTRISVPTVHEIRSRAANMARFPPIRSESSPVPGRKVAKKALKGDSQSSFSSFDERQLKQMGRALMQRKSRLTESYSNVPYVSYGEFHEDNPQWRDTMEDATLIIPTEFACSGNENNGCLFSVFDGHGGAGVAILVKQILGRRLSSALVEARGMKFDSADQTEQLNEQVEYAFSDAFLRVDVEANCDAHPTPDSRVHNPSIVDAEAKGPRLRSGATAICCYLEQREEEWWLHTANIGDARAIVCLMPTTIQDSKSPSTSRRRGTSRRAAPSVIAAPSVMKPASFMDSAASSNVSNDGKDPTSSFKNATRLSYDHKATDPAEVQRIESVGGLVVFGRVGGRLAIARAFGDTDLKSYGLSAQPFVTHVRLKRSDEKTRHSHIVVACDGIWDVLEDEEVAEILTVEYGQEKDGRKLAQVLVDRSLARGTRDNVSAVVVVL